MSAAAGLGRLEDIEDGKGMRLGAPGDAIIVVRQGDRLHAWKDVCPHAGQRLSLPDGRVLVHRSGNIICPAHGASFDLASGDCTGGPAAGECLIEVEVEVVAGEIRRR